MSAPESVNGAAAPTIRRLPLPGAEPPDADALRALHAAGAHFVLCRAHDEGTKKAKSALQRGWQTAAPLLDAVIEHRGRGGLVGMMPGSIGAVVVDLAERERLAALSERYGVAVATICHDACIAGLGAVVERMRRAARASAREAGK